MSIYQTLFNPVNSIQWQSIQSIPPQTFWIIFSGFSLILIVILYRTYQSIIKARTIEDTPLSKIRSASQGRVELEGKQHTLSGMPLVAPYSKIPCTWYYGMIVEYRKSKWIEIERIESQHYIILNDGSGECIIDPLNAKISPLKHDQWGGFQRNPIGKPTSWLSRFIGSFGSYRYLEYRMEENDELYVIGDFKTILLSEAPENLKEILIHHRLPTSSINVLSSGGSTSRQPYILSALSQYKTAQKARRDAILWSTLFLIISTGLCFVFMIRMFSA